MEKLRIYCNSCKNETRHEIEARHTQEREDSDFGFPQMFEAEILRCCGCDLLSFRLLTHPFEFQDENTEIEEEIYPERGFKRRERRYSFKLPKEVRILYKETLEAHDKN